MVKNILITGATGFIGNHFLEFILKNPENNVYSIVRPQSKKKELLRPSNNHVIVYSEINHLKNNSLINSIRFDSVYHFAWMGSYGLLRNDESIQSTNFSESLSFIDYCVNKKINKIFISGSQEEIEPQTKYGLYKSKLKESLIKYDKNIIWGRIFSVFGGNENKSNFVPYVIDSLYSNNPLTINFPNKQWNFLYIKDAVNIIFKLVSSLTSYHEIDIASENSKRIIDYVNEIMEVTKISTNILSVSNQNIESKFKLNTSYYYNLLGIKEKYSFKEGIKDLIQSNN